MGRIQNTDPRNGEEQRRHYIAVVSLEPERGKCSGQDQSRSRSQRRRRGIIRSNQELVHQMQAEVASLILGPSFGGHGSRMAESVRASIYVHKPTSDEGSALPEKIKCYVQPYLN